MTHTCEGGCGTETTYGLDLRFCPECRQKQPVPDGRVNSRKVLARRRVAGRPTPRETFQTGF